MKRNQVTTIRELKPGDRFYKQSNKTKVAMEFIGETSVHDKFEVCEAAAIGKNGFAKKVQIKECRGSTVVIYLRNVNDKL